VHVNLYWYVSKAKLELLADQAPGFFTGVKAQLGFKLPLLSGSLEGTEPTRTEGDLQRVIRRLRSENQIIEYADLQDTDSPTLVSFEGAAVRQISHDVFWLAMRGGRIGLLLAGSAASVIGTQPKGDSAGNPLGQYASGNPVGTIRNLFEDASGYEQPAPDLSQPGKAESEPAMPRNSKFVLVNPRETISSHATMAWAELMAEANEGTLPRATGLALFARSVKADPNKLKWLGEAGEGVERIAVGSPIYVQQM
jgi:hypothetical protein